MSLKDFILNLRKISKTYQSIVHDTWFSNYVTNLANSSDQEIDVLSENQLLKKIWSSMKDYITSFSYFNLNTVDEVELKTIKSFISHTLGLPVNLIYMIDQDFDYFIKQYGDRETAHLKIEHAMKKYFYDSLLVAKLDKGSVKIRIKTKMISVLRKIKDIDRHPLLEGYARMGKIDVDSVSTKQMILLPLKVKNFEVVNYSIYIHEQKHKERLFRLNLKSVGIKDEICVDMMSQENINHKGYLDAYIYSLSSWLEYPNIYGVDSLSTFLKLDDHLKEEMREAVNDSQYITPFEWFKEKLQTHFLY